jgi:SAM-dependent methyltransferase
MFPLPRLCLVAIVSSSLVLLGSLVAADRKEVEIDAPFVPTPQAVVEKMLKVARVTKKDIVYDLGCGDGRIVCTAARKYGCKAYGFDIDPDRIKDCAASKAKLDRDTQKLITFKKQDIFAKDFDISEATVVTLYLLQSLNVKLIPKFKTLKPGCRIVSHAFPAKGMTPDKGFPISMNAKDDLGKEKKCDIYLWTTPLKFAK